MTIWMVLSGVMMGVIILLLILCGGRYLSRQESDINFIKTSYQLVSLRSTIKDKKLR